MIILFYSMNYAEKKIKTKIMILNKKKQYLWKEFLSYIILVIFFYKSLFLLSYN